MLGGCSTVPGVFNGLGSDPMSMLIVYRTDKQPITQKQYTSVVEIAQEASKQVGLQLSSAAEAAASSGVMYGAAGAAGGAIENALTAGITSTVTVLGGLVNGLETASYANAWLVADLTETTLRDRERDGEDFRRLHVSAAFTRTKNTAAIPARGIMSQ